MGQNNGVQTTIFGPLTECLAHGRSDVRIHVRSITATAVGSPWWRIGPTVPPINHLRMPGTRFGVDGE